MPPQMLPTRASPDMCVCWIFVNEIERTELIAGHLIHSYTLQQLAREVSASFCACTDSPHSVEDGVRVRLLVRDHHTGKRDLEAQNAGLSVSCCTAAAVYEL